MVLVGGECCFVFLWGLCGSDFGGIFLWMEITPIYGFDASCVQCERLGLEIGALLTATTLCRVWDLKTGECKQVLKGHTSTVNSVGITPEGNTAISGSDDYTVRYVLRAVLWCFGC